MNIECQYPYEDPIEVFAFRTHAHTNGQVITGYRKRWRFISGINFEIIEEEKYTYTPAVYKNRTNYQLLKDSVSRKAGI